MTTTAANGAANGQVVWVAGRRQPESNTGDSRDSEALSEALSEARGHSFSEWNLFDSHHLPAESAAGSSQDVEVPCSS